MNRGVNGDAALRELLRANPESIVTAIGPGHQLVPLPDTVPVDRHHVFGGRQALDLLVPEDRLAMVDVWARAQHEPVVEVKVHLVADPEREATLHLIDVRSEHGVHVAVLEGQVLEVLLRSSAVRDLTRRRVAHVTRDALAKFLDVDEQATALLGWSREELIGLSTVDLIHPDDREQALENWLSMRNRRGNRQRVRLRRSDGQYVWVEVTNDNRLDDPAVGCVLSELVDISDEMAHLEALHDRERLLARLAEALPIGICQVRLDRQVVYSNELLLGLLGPLRTVEELVASVVAGDRERVRNALEDAFEGIAEHHEVTVERDGQERRCELTFRTMTDDDGTIDGVIVCAADVTDRSRLRAELEHRANHDALTGCLNRAATATAVDRLLAEDRRVAVAFIDLDGFKAINDDIGHAAGDELLQIAAARLRRVTRDGDLLGRLGGDEFVVVCSGGDAFDATELRDRLARALNDDVLVHGRPVRLRASVGAAVSLPGEVGAEGLLQRADAAMYEAKRNARLFASY